MCVDGTNDDTVDDDDTFPSSDAAIPVAADAAIACTEADVNDDGVDDEDDNDEIEESLVNGGG